MCGFEYFFLCPLWAWMNVLKSWSEEKLQMQMARKALPDDWRTGSQTNTLSDACFLAGQNVEIGQMSKKPLQQSMWKEEGFCNKNTSVHSTYRLFLECLWNREVGGEGRKLIGSHSHLIISLLSAKPACFQTPLMWSEDLWCPYCGPGGQENKGKLWRSASVQESFSEHFTNVRKDTEQGCWTAEKYVTCLERFMTGLFLVLLRKLTFKTFANRSLFFLGRGVGIPSTTTTENPHPKTHHRRKVWSWENRGENINLPRGSDNFFDRKVHSTSQSFFSATVTLPTHFTVNSFEGKEKECLMQTHVMEMSVQSIRIAEAGSRALCHEVYNR